MKSRRKDERATASKYHVAAIGLALIASPVGAAEIAKVSPPPATPAPPAPPPGPMGVFGLDIPAPGKLVVSLTPNFANLSGMRMGTRSVSNEYIVSTVPFFLNPRQPVRVVPQNIAVRTQTLALNYGVWKDMSILLTAGMVEKTLEALVFRAPSGITPLARNYPDTVGLQDFTLSGLYRLYQDDIHRIQVSLGFAFPTGSNHATFNNFILPNGSAQNIRGFYGMQLGNGTFDIMPGVVYAGFSGPFSWGVSYRGRFPLAANPEGYLWGDLHELNGWGGYTVIPGLTATVRATASLQGQIRGFDPQINRPAVPANPAFYGGQRVELFGGATISGKFIGYENWSLAIEAGAPVYQNLNGPQIEKNWQAGFQVKVKI